MSSVMSTGTVQHPQETLDSYTTSKGSRSDLHKTVPESDVPSEKPAEQDELFVANIHGDVDYRMRPPVPSEPPKGATPFSASQSGWIGGDDQFPPLPASPTLQQPEGQYVGGVVGTRSLLPGPFSQNSSIPSKSGPLLAMPGPTMPPRISKTQGLLPTPESSKLPDDRDERGRENRDGRRQKSDVAETQRDRARYKDRPFDERPSSRDDHQHRRRSRERSDADHRTERRGRSRSRDRTLPHKSASSSQLSAEHSKVPRAEEALIIIDDDCEDIPLPPLPPPTSASKTTDTSAPLAESSASKSQNFDVDRKVLLPTPADKQVSTREKRKLDDPRREQKFSRWDHRRSIRSSPSSSKAVSETKGKKALLETPVASGSSESGRFSDSADNSYHADAKDPRNAKRDADSKSYERRRSRSRSRTKHVASNLLDRSRRKVGLLRHQRSSSQDRRHSSSRSTAAHEVRRRSRSRERPAVRSTSRDQLEEEEHRLRKQLDDLIARKNEGSRGTEHQFRPSYPDDQRREQSLEIPRRFDLVPNPEARTDAVPPHSRRHLLPAPRLTHHPPIIRGRPPLDPPVVPMPADVASRFLRPIVDRNIGPRYSQPSDQPLLQSGPMLPGRPFIQEYSHKPADAHTDQPSRFTGEVADRNINSPPRRRDPEPGRPPAFREELGQHRFRPYPVPEDRHRIPPEPARNRHARDRPNEETDVSSKSSDFRDARMLDRKSAGMDEVGLVADVRISEHSSPAFFAADQNPAACRSPAVTPRSASHSPAPPEVPDIGDGLLPLSSAPIPFSAGEIPADNSGQQAAEATTADENEVMLDVPNVLPQHPTMPPMPIPPNFPAFVQHVRNMMFARGVRGMPFNPMAFPRMRGALRPPLPGFPPVPASAPAVCQGSAPPMNRAPMALPGPSLEALAPSKKSLLGDYPRKQVPSLMAELTANVSSDMDSGPEMVQSGEEQDDGEQAQDDDVGPSHLMGNPLMAPPPPPPRLIEPDQPQHIAPLPVDSATDDETGEDLLEEDESNDQEDSSAIPPLMDFSVYRSRAGTAEATTTRPPLFSTPPMRLRMALPVRGMIPRGVRVPRPMSPAVRAAAVEMRGGIGSAFPRRGGPSFPPRGTSPRYA